MESEVEFNELTITQAARILGLSRQRLHQLTREGAIYYRKNEFGWKIFSRKDVEAFSAKRAALRRPV